MAKRYLIVKIAAIGDVIMALPMVKEIRKMDKDANITWICGKSVLPIIKMFPIDNVIAVDDKDLLTGKKIKKISVVFNIWKKIAFKKYDVIALGHAARRYQILTMLTRGTLCHSFSHVMGRIWPVPGRHHSDEYVRLIKSDNRVSIHSVEFPIMDLPIRIKKLINWKKKKVVLAPGGAKNLLADDYIRRWPINNYVELTKRLLQNNFEVIVIGGKGDSWVNDYFSDLKIVNLIGETGLRELISLFQNTDVAVVHDSGPMHLAGGTNVKLICIFGPTNPVEKAPNRENVYILCKSDKFACCPCYDGKYYAMCKKNDCMESIDVESVLNCIID